MYSLLRFLLVFLTVWDHFVRQDVLFSQVLRANRTDDVKVIAL